MVAGAAGGVGSMWRDLRRGRDAAAVRVARARRAGVRIALDATAAERRKGAPAMGRSTGVVGETTGATVASSDGEETADGRPMPAVQRDVAEATPDFRWNSCRFIATRFQ